MTAGKLISIKVFWRQTTLLILTFGSGRGIWVEFLPDRVDIAARAGFLFLLLAALSFWPSPFMRR